MIKDSQVNGIADPTFDCGFLRDFMGFWLVSSVRQAFDPYLDGPLNGETVPQTTKGMYCEFI
jgi:hypothetical protein